MDLLRRFALGEIDAFETLVRQFQGDIYAWIVRIVRDPGTAEDLTVETLWRIYRARQQFRPDGNFAAWARRIATNLAVRSSPAQTPGAESARRTRRGSSVRSSRPAGNAREDPAGLSPPAGQVAGGRGTALRRNCRCLRDIGWSREAARFPGGSHPSQTTEPSWSQAGICENKSRREMRIRK